MSTRQSPWCWRYAQYGRFVDCVGLFGNVKTQIDAMKRDPHLDSPRVYDIGLDRHGKIIRSGPQQSLVRFDDGVERIIPNQHLQACDVKNARSHARATLP
jgi:hypothetical protein